VTFDHPSNAERQFSRVALVPMNFSVQKATPETSCNALPIQIYKHTKIYPYASMMIRIAKGNKIFHYRHDQKIV
jgi:hypothetical protein